MMYAAGIDVGSTQTKGIIIDQDQRIIARALGMTGANVTRAGARNIPASIVRSIGREQEEHSRRYTTTKQKGRPQSISRLLLTRVRFIDDARTRNWLAATGKALRQADLTFYTLG